MSAPSKAARELAEKIMFGEMSVALVDFSKYPLTSDQRAKLDKLSGQIQSALADLLTQAQYVIDAGPEDRDKCVVFLAKALAPWKPGE